MSKNKSFYRAFDRNRPIETIDGYDGTLHRGPFRLSRGRLPTVVAPSSQLYLPRIEPSS